MMCKKGFVISLDLMIAIPLAFAAITALALGMEHSYAAISGSSGYDLGFLHSYSASQGITSAIYSLHANYSTASEIAGASTRGFGSAYITGESGTGACGIRSLCWFVTIRTATYLMVVNYENTSKP